MKAYILDDEIKGIELLRNYISKVDFLDVEATSTSPLTAFNYLKDNEVDVLFLDINMPIISGVELLKSLVKKPKVIFTTAHTEYAVDAFDFDAVDYLVKPISFSRFLQACQKLNRNQLDEIDDQKGDQGILSDIIYVKSGTITHKLSWRDIRYLEKEENYVVYHTEELKILARQTLSDIEKMFPDYIVRVHKSFAISLLHVNQIKNDKVVIGSIDIPVGRSHKEELRSRVEHFNKNEL